MKGFLRSACKCIGTSLPPRKKVVLCDQVNGPALLLSDDDETPSIPKASHGRDSPVRAGSTRGNHEEPASGPSGPLKLSHCRLKTGAPGSGGNISNGMLRNRLSEKKKGSQCSRVWVELLRSGLSHDASKRNSALRTGLLLCGVDFFSGHAHVQNVDSGKAKVPPRPVPSTSSLEWKTAQALGVLLIRALLFRTRAQHKRAVRSLSKLCSTVRLPVSLLAFPHLRCAASFSINAFPSRSLCSACMCVCTSLPPKKRRLAG